MIDHTANVVFLDWEGWKMGVPQVISGQASSKQLDVYSCLYSKNASVKIN